MDWINEHLLQIIIAVAAAIAAYLNNRKKEKDGEPADYDGDGVPDNRPGQFDSQRMDMDEAERTRRVQDEIRRKIAERRAGGGQPVEPPPLVAPRPIAPPPLPDLMRKRAEERAAAAEQARRRAAAALAAQEARDEQAAEEQRAMQAQLRQLEARRAEAKRQAAEVAGAATMAAYRGAPAGKGSAGELLADLRAPGGARRAWILREVLGTPAGLK
jgi:hypothetical protein